METRKIRTWVSWSATLWRPALQEDFTKCIDVTADDDACARVGAVTSRGQMSLGVSSRIRTVDVLPHPPEPSLHRILANLGHDGLL